MLYTPLESPFSTMIELKKLSNRELEILRNVLNGKSSKEISIDLGISPRTTDTHRKSIASIRGNSKAVEWDRYAIKYGIIKI